MDGQLGTHDGSSGRPCALLEISFPTKNSSTPYLNMHTVFVTGEDEYSRYKHRRYKSSWPETTSLVSTIRQTCADSSPGAAPSSDRANSVSSPGPRLILDGANAAV
jgi:hypothetical protein